MAIRETYATYLIEQILRAILREGENPSASEIAERFETFVANNDISNPLFNAATYQVSKGQPSSISLYNASNNAIHQDLLVLFRHLLKVSDQSIRNFERWRAAAKLLEGRLDELNERINFLLLISSDTAGFFNFMQDTFVDNKLVDLENTTTLVDVDRGIVTLGTSTSGATRLDLSTLRNEHVEFTVLSRVNLVSSISAEKSQTKHAVSDITNFWQERVYTNKPGAVSAELKINLLTKREISRIDLDLHMANQNSSVQVTPLYSTDNFNWKQLPIKNFTRSVVDKTIFRFPPVEAKWVKFNMTKLGADQVHNNLYSYEFGVDEIVFYSEGFSTETTATLISQPLSVLDQQGNIEEFSRVVLEVCEDVPENTNIDYSVSVFNDIDDPIGGFVPIDPLDRVNSTKPTVLDFGDLDTVTVSGIRVSYDATASDPDFINPAEQFTRIESVSGSTVNSTIGTASDIRYSFANTNERILDHVISSNIKIAQRTLEVWRNVNIKNNNTKVRGIANGWGFNDPWYRTTVYVANASGYNIDFGSKAVVVDDVIQTGKINISPGRHTIQVHKDNWKAIDVSSVTNLEDLITADPLYPYNHRYLIEGLLYPSGYSTTDEKIYRGFDIVAEYFMKEVSIFDIINNIQADDYQHYAVDLDATDPNRLIDSIPASADEQLPQRSFVLKVNENNPDFLNERFLIRFKSANSLFKYLRFKAELSTSDSAITPILDAYRLKISS